MKILVEMKFGSHLYGTATASSDMDIKGIYLPPLRDILLNAFPKTINSSVKLSLGLKNEADDTDREFYSLHYFIELACKGETVAMDMLHAPDSALIETSPIWTELRSHRALFYTKNLKSLVGYARRQAAKYGVKGSRLAVAKLVLSRLEEGMFYGVGDSSTVGEILDQLPVTEHSGSVVKDGVEFYQVCGKYLTLSAKASHYHPMMRKFIDEYGDRARAAEANEGIDWKAVSHALRAGYQVRGILRDGDFTYPLPETDYLKAVKAGSLSFKDNVGPRLESLMDEVEALNVASHLPDEVDRDIIQMMFLRLLYNHYDGGRE